MITNFAKRAHTRQGFLLIEALAAIALSAFLACLIAHYHATVLIWYHNGLRRLQALAIASNYIEASTGARIFSETPEITQHDIFTITQEAIPAQLNLSGQELEQFVLAKIVISWQSVQGKKESMQFYAS